MNKKTAVAVAALASPCAMAQAYLGADIGSSHFSDSGCPGGVSCSDASWKLTGGYRFGAGWAAEIGYIDLGRTDVQAYVGPVGVNVHAITLGAAYEAAVSESWGVGARFGVAQVKTSGGSAYFGGSGIPVFTVVDAQTRATPYIGLLGTFSITPSLKLEASADWMRADLGNVNSLVSLLAVGARYEF